MECVLKQLEEIVGLPKGALGRYLDEEDILEKLDSDIVSYEDRIEIVIPVPGAKREDITIEFQERVLSVKAKSSYEANLKDAVSYTCDLPSKDEATLNVKVSVDIIEDKIDAKLEYGLLYLTLPKVEKKKTKINIK